MRSFNKKLYARYFFVVIAIAIAASFLFISNRTAEELAKDERLKIELWADAIQTTVNRGDEGELDLTLKILSGNKTIPVIWCDDEGEILMTVNLDIPAKDSLSFIKKKIVEFQKNNEPIVIRNPDFVQYVYYGDSSTLKRLQYYPFIQILILTVFVMISFLALLSTKNAEQNKLWVGLSKETAHQLGTPISSLLAWIEYLKEKTQDASIVGEMEKDIIRLQMITDRFSKIGSKPAPQLYEIKSEVMQAVSYLEKRISKKVKFIFDMPDEPIYAKISPSLFSWVIENLTKNAVDAMEGQGTITFDVYSKSSTIYIDITDTGKGMTKSMYKQIFSPGFTTKDRGWGLGLSLAKRIIESYHRGKIYVRNSELNVGTTFTIELEKQDIKKPQD